MSAAEHIRRALARLVAADGELDDAYADSARAHAAAALPTHAADARLAAAQTEQEAALEDARRLLTLAEKAP